MWCWIALFSSQPGSSALRSARPAPSPTGCIASSLQFQVGGAVVEKAIEGAFLSSLTPRPPLSSLAERKAEASRWFAQNGELLVGRVLAMLHSGEVDAPVMRTILERTIDFIVNREDCSDFWMVPLLWIWRDYRDQLPEDLRQAVKEAILGYRYWVDEPGNDAMWFWSENHVLCFHVTQHVAGRLFPDETFANSGRSGRDQEREGAEKLARWFDSIEREGLAEWNSSAYYPIDFIGLLGLQHMADAPLKARAAGMLDRICQMVALHTTAGVPGGSQGRAYNKELLGGPLTELVSIVRIAFGTGWLNHGVTAPPMLAASDYEPPASAIAFADPGEGQSLEARYTQGLDHTARLVVYRTRDAQLSSVVDHNTGRHGHQQHVVDVQLSGHPLARLFVNHPGEEDPSGNHRPSFWAGNGVLPRVGQLLDVSMLVFDLGRRSHRLDAWLLRPRRHGRHRAFRRLAVGSLRQGGRRPVRRQRPLSHRNRPDRRTRSSLRWPAQRLDRGHRPELCRAQGPRRNRRRALRQPSSPARPPIARSPRADPVVRRRPQPRRPAAAVQPFHLGADH